MKGETAFDFTGDVQSEGNPVTISHPKNSNCWILHRRNGKIAVMNEIESAERLEMKGMLESRREYQIEATTV